MDNLGSIAATISGGFFTGMLIGWALKKIAKLLAIIIGIFLAGLAYLQYRQIASINWDEIERASEGIMNTLINSTTKMIEGDHPGLAELELANFGIPLTGSISIGFILGFMKG